MIDAPSVFHLSVDRDTLFDGSARGVGTVVSGNIALRPAEQAVDFADGSIEIARHPSLDELQAFTVSAIVRPAVLGDTRHTILEGQSPAIALYIDEAGRLVGEVNTAQGPVAIDSGAEVMAADREYRVQFSRAEDGTTRLQLDDRVVAQVDIAAPLQRSGDAGFRVGARAVLGGAAFVGEIGNLVISPGAVDAALRLRRRQRADQICQQFIQQTGLSHVLVVLEPDESHVRLQPVKQIMNAAGVSRISDLDTLRISAPTTMTPGTVLVAARKPVTAPPQWAAVASAFRQADVGHRQLLLAEHLTNRNSGSVLERIGAVREPPEGGGTPHGGTPHGGTPHGDGGAPRPPRGGGVPGGRLRLAERLELRKMPGELFQRVGGELRVADPTVLGNLESVEPSAWPVLTAGGLLTQAPATLPVNSSVIIAGKLDLTNIKLLVAPTVSTLYIIAEEIVCGPNASITWQRPGGSTPPRADNPDLNGRGFPGEQTEADSRDGLDGEDGAAGLTGLSGARGRNAPNLEIWTKRMTAMPDLDLAGEGGIRGGRGQKGGDGGCGGDGAAGKWMWLFTSFCISDPGDGGDGGNGGRGGEGGRGGDGGNGGRITIGVLQDTLTDTVTNHPFKIKNAGGPVGQGGLGGPGGSGGSGGWSGNGEHCTSAEDGHPGADGQPGALGAVATHAGGDGLDEFVEFTEAAWDDLITRPWLTDLVPAYAFPGDAIVLRGSRFTANDRVMVGSDCLIPVENADESISIALPQTVPGGVKTVFVRREDGTESNRLTLWIKPQLDTLTVEAIVPGANVPLTGHAFLTGASVLLNGAAIPATVSSPTALSFDVPGTGGTGSSGGTATLAVRNPDGLVSTARPVALAGILEVPFRFTNHALSFGNPDWGVPDWGTFEDTFGTAEVWHELLDPIFGHPLLTVGYFEFYKYFLKGVGHGGLATGFCTALASLVADRFWQGLTDTPTLTLADNHRLITAVHGKLLSRETLLTMHDQGREADARVERTYREIEATFLRGCDRDNQPLLFFIPKGEIWDSGYTDKLASSHCVMPYRFVYPTNRIPSLSADGTTTTTDPNGVRLFVWDCNAPSDATPRVEFRRSAGTILFDYWPAGAAQPLFRSEDGFTLGMMTHGAYHLADHDLPFGGPFGLTSFIVDFLASPADLQITDGAGARTGVFGGQILAEIPGSHPAYMVKGMYLLPADTALTRRIVGTSNGQYTYSSILPSGASVVIEGVATAAGQEDVVAINADGTELRITPSADKTFTITLARQVGDQARAIAIAGAGGSAASPVDVTVSPELSLVRLGNRAADRTVEVRAFAIDKAANVPVNRQLPNVALPTNHDLVVTVTDWSAVDLAADAVAF